MLCQRHLGARVQKEAHIQGALGARVGVYALPTSTHCRQSRCEALWPWQAERQVGARCCGVDDLQKVTVNDMHGQSQENICTDDKVKRATTQGMTDN